MGNPNVMPSRRDLLRWSVAGVAALGAAPLLRASQDKKRIPLSVQMYSVRDIKDLMAATVLVASIVSAAVGIIIIFPHLATFFSRV